MAQTLQLSLKTSVFQRKKNLIITPDSVEYDDVDFSKFEITELRYGIKSINGYRFRIGRMYCVDIKSLTGNIIKLRFISLYQIRRRKLDEKYTSILQAVFENFINDLSRDYIDKFNKQTDFVLLGVTFTQEGIRLNEKADLISWLDLGTRNYRTYYSLFSNSEPTKFRTFHYLTDWNTAVLYSVSRYISKAQDHLK